jgi:uncharacterized membrane protein
MRHFSKKYTLISKIKNMKIVKKILLYLGILIALALIIALFIKKDYALEREIVINKPKQEVFDYLRFLKNQNNWSTWILGDPAMTQTFSGTDGEIGTTSSWKSKEMGNGQQEFKKIINGERIDAELRFEGTAPANAYFITESVSGTQTKVKWGMTGKMFYPTNLMMPFVNSMIGTEYEKSLQNLKKVLEK